MVVHHGCKVWPTSFSWKSWRSLTITAAKSKGDAAVIYPAFRALLTVLASWLEIADKISSQMSQILYRAFMPPGATLFMLLLRNTKCPFCLLSL